VLAISKAERDAMHACIEHKGVRPIDRNRRCCPLRSDEGTCMVWEARPQVCRLHHCQVPRREVLRQNPAIVVPERLALRAVLSAGCDRSSGLLRLSVESVEAGGFGLPQKLSEILSDQLSAAANQALAERGIRFSSVRISEDRIAFAL